MTGTDDLFKVLGRLGELRTGVAAQVLGIAIPEMLKDVVEGMDGFEFASEPLRQALSGLGGLGQVFGPEIAKALGELTGSVKDLWNLGGGSDVLAQVTKSVGELQQFNPLRGG